MNPINFFRPFNAQGQREFSKTRVAIVAVLALAILGNVAAGVQLSGTYDLINAGKHLAMNTIVPDALNLYKAVTSLQVTLPSIAAWKVAVAATAILGGAGAIYGIRRVATKGKREEERKTKEELEGLRRQKQIDAAQKKAEEAKNARVEALLPKLADKNNVDANELVRLETGKDMKTNDLYRFKTGIGQYMFVRVTDAEKNKLDFLPYQAKEYKAATKALKNLGAKVVELPARHAFKPEEVNGAELADESIGMVEVRPTETRTANEAPVQIQSATTPPILAAPPALTTPPILSVLTESQVLPQTPLILPQLGSQALPTFTVPAQPPSRPDAPIINLSATQMDAAIALKKEQTATDSTSALSGTETNQVADIKNDSDNNS